MALYSDQILEPKSAKSRILSSIRRKVDNSTLSTEIYEEVCHFHEILFKNCHQFHEIFLLICQDEDSADEQDVDMRQKLSRTKYVVGKSNNGKSSVSSRSSIFNRVGSTRSRKSSEHYQDEDSGDSLERDKGEDLGEMQMQMKIQVTQSDAEEEEVEEGEEEPQKQTERRYWSSKLKGQKTSEIK